MFEAYRRNQSTGLKDNEAPKGDFAVNGAVKHQLVHLGDLFT